MAKKIFFMLTITVFLINSVFSQGFWHRQLPVPRYSEKISSSEQTIMGRKVKINTYAAGLTIEELQNFYRDKLPSAGWEPLGGFGAALSFKKGDKVVNINIMPPNPKYPNKTIFSVSESGIGGGIFSIDSLPSPKVSGLPVYPGAKEIMNNVKPCCGGALTFYIKDSAEEACSFYREKMPDYGWQLESESNLSDFLSSENMAKAIGKDSPAYALVKTMKFGGYVLRFSKGKEAAMVLVYDLKSFNFGGLFQGIKVPPIQGAQFNQSLGGMDFNGCYVNINIRKKVENEAGK